MVRAIQVKNTSPTKPILSLKKETIINMPYITQNDRQYYEKELNLLVDKLVEFFSNEPTKISSSRAGHINYLITSLIKRFYTKLQKKLLHSDQLKYSDQNEIIGALECAKQEWYRRQISIYEDSKIKENGDV
jgi:hypothetical protein